MALSYGFNLDAAGKTYTSKQWCDAWHQIAGNHVADYQGKFALTLSGGLSFTISPGYAYVNGRWARLNAAANFSLPIAMATRERYDALALIANLSTRLVTMEVISDIDPDAPLRNDSVYTVYLYTFRVGMSATDLTGEDITDKREILYSYSSVAAAVDAIYVYMFTTFPNEVASIRALGQDKIDAWPDEKATLISNWKTARQYRMGDIIQSAGQPVPEEDWLACDGSTIPNTYSGLATFLGQSTLPNLTAYDDRFTMYIYAVAGYGSDVYSGYVTNDDATPDVPDASGTSTDVDPIPEPIEEEIPTNAITDREGNALTDREGNYITYRV